MCVAPWATLNCQMSEFVVNIKCVNIKHWVWVCMSNVFVKTVYIYSTCDMLDSICNIII